MTTLDASPKSIRNTQWIKAIENSKETSMPITRQTIAEKLAAYLHHELTLAQLVDWAETALMDDELEGNQTEQLAAVLARLGVADVRAFGLTWEDCEDTLHQLGYAARVEVAAA